MPTYITLCRWTQQGIQQVKESPKRLEKAKKVIKAKGGSLKTAYMTIGQYDFVVIAEAPSDEAFAEAMLAISTGGAIRSETLRAFNEAEYKKIIAGLP